MIVPVAAVAKFIIQDSDRISNLKLQKLLYYVQGWHLGLKSKPLFDEELQAWMHGPVVPEVFREYRKFGWQTIEKPARPVMLPATESRHVKRVLSAYRKYSADQLIRLSHSEKPWLDARNGIPDGEASTAEITHESMRDFFARKART